LSKSSRRQLCDRAAAQEAEDVEKGENAVACQGQSIKDAKWQGEVQLNGCPISVADAKRTSAPPK
jgi:hypothetical protein